MALLVCLITKAQHATWMMSGKRPLCECNPGDADFHHHEESSAVATRKLGKGWRRFVDRKDPNGERPVLVQVDREADEATEKAALSSFLFDWRSRQSGRRGPQVLQTEKRTI
jgi:hypothetical protein